MPNPFLIFLVICLGIGTYGAFDQGDWRIVPLLLFFAWLCKPFLPPR